MSPGRVAGEDNLEGVRERGKGALDYDFLVPSCKGAGCRAITEMDISERFFSVSLSVLFVVLYFLCFLVDAMKPIGNII